MRKKLILSILSIVVLLNIAGCGADNSTSDDKPKTKSELVNDTFKDEVEKYDKLLSSGKSYDEMTDSEKADFSEIENSLNNFTYKFKNKYSKDIKRIQKSKSKDVTKKEKENTASKNNEEASSNKKTEENKKETTVKKKKPSSRRYSKDKAFSDITTSAPDSVKKDVTGKLRVIKVRTTKDILDYAKNYYENNFSNKDEIHGIINSQLNKTFKIDLVLGNVLDIAIHKYVSREETDAKKLFSGELLENYSINLRNGEIKKIT